MPDEISHAALGRSAALGVSTTGARQDRQARVDGYVRRIMVNENNSLWRRPWKRRELAADELPETDVHEDAYDDGQGAALWQFVQTLPRKQRAVVVLRYYEELSEAEIADAVGISPEP